MENDSRAKMIASAATLISLHGINDTSFSDVLDHSGAPRGSIYHHFPEGKAQLAEDAVHWTSGRVMAHQAAYAGTTARGVVERFIAMWRNVVVSSGGATGSSAKKRTQKKKRTSTADRRESLAKGIGGARAASARGLKATAKRAENARPLARKGLSRTGKILTPVVVLFLRGAGIVQRGITSVLRNGRRGLAWTIRLLDRVFTPARVVVALTIACAACMIVAQYVDYRGVEIGQPQYAQVADIAPPPQVDVHQAADNHSKVIFGLQVSVIVPIAILAALLAIAALVGNRRKLGRLISLAGVAGILITLLIDKPRGLDEGDAGLAFAGAHAKLAEGFYAELAASAGLVLCGLLLILHLRPASARSPKRRRRPSPSKPDASKRRTPAKRPRPAPSLPKGVGKGDSGLAKGSSS